MSRTITIVLPVEASGPVQGMLAPGVASFAGAPLGVVDNGLWHAMRHFTTYWRDRVVVDGATGVEVVPFDHLAADFAEQQRALGPFGRRVKGVVTGLGN